MSTFTERAIKEAFIKLLEEQPLSQITVKAIAEKCGINRNSFYYHFQDIPALVEEIVKEFFDEIINRYPSIAVLEDCIEAALRYSLEHRRTIMHLHDSVSRDVYERYLMRFCEYAVTVYIDTAYREAAVGDADKKMIIRLLKCELFGAYTEWMSLGMPESAIEELRRLLVLCHGMSEEIIRRCNAQRSQTEGR